LLEYPQACDGTFGHERGRIAVGQIEHAERPAPVLVRVVIVWQQMR
jgi:hypothetical protein